MGRIGDSPLISDFGNTAKPKFLTDKTTQETIKETEPAEVPKSPSYAQWSAFSPSVLKNVATLYGCASFKELLDTFPPDSMNLILNDLELLNPTKAPSDDEQVKYESLESLAQAATFISFGVLRCLEPLSGDIAPSDSLTEGEVQTTEPSVSKFSKETLKEVERQINWDELFDEEEFKSTIAGEQNTLDDLQGSLEYIQNVDYKAMMKDSIDIPEETAKYIKKKMIELLKEEIEVRKGMEET